MTLDQIVARLDCWTDAKQLLHVFRTPWRLAIIIPTSDRLDEGKDLGNSNGSSSKHSIWLNSPLVSRTFVMNNIFLVYSFVG